MVYKKIQDLPDQVKDNLPKHAQDIFKEAFNSAWEQYKDPKSRNSNESREEVANKVAWSAVKNVYTKNKKGNWVKKDSE